MKKDLKMQKWAMLLLLNLFVGAIAAQTNSSPEQTVCIGSEPYRVVSTSGSIYTWSINPGSSGQEWTINGTGNAISIDWRVPGTFTLSVAELNAAGCYGLPVEVIVTVIAAPTVDPVADVAYCNGAATQAITFSSSVPGTTFSWTNSNTAIGLGASGTGAIPSFIATNTGTTPVTSTITVIPSYNTCTGIPVTFTINVNPVPTPSIIGSAPLVCESVHNNTEIYSTANVSGNTYIWTVTGGTFTGQGTNQIVVTWTTPGTGSVSVTEIVGSAGCSATDTKVITIQAAPDTGPIFHN